MWEPFTESARKAIVQAQQEAQRMGNNFIGTEHLLLGVLSDEVDGLARFASKLEGVHYADVAREIEYIVGSSPKSVQSEMSFSPRAKVVIENAFAEARDLGDNYVGTEHLLLGILRTGEGVAVKVLEELCCLDSLRKRVLKERAKKTPAINSLEFPVEKPQPPNTVRVRIQVAVNSHGQWQAQGWSVGGPVNESWDDGEDRGPVRLPPDDDYDKGLMCDSWPDGPADHYVWVEADVPLPMAQTVKGEVKR